MSLFTNCAAVFNFIRNYYSTAFNTVRVSDRLDRLPNGSSRS